MNTYETKWAKTVPNSIFQDDNLIFETLDGQARFIMRCLEFEWIARKLYEKCFLHKQCRYIQLVRDWNKCLGFDDSCGNFSVLTDIPDTIEALQLVDYKPGVEEHYIQMEKADAEALTHFLTINSFKGIKVYKE